MTAFDYEALDVLGRVKRGVITADNARLARKELRHSKLVPVKLEPASQAASRNRVMLPTPWRDRIPSADVMLATRQLATMVNAAAPIEEALNVIALQAENRALRNILLNVRASVIEGARLSEALAAHPRVFTPLYVALVSAGEMSGALGAILERLADHLEKTSRLRAKVLTALIYPAVLAAVAGLMVLLLLIFVVPKIVDQFASLGQDLPWLTRALIVVSEGLQSYGLIGLALIALAAVVLKRELRKPAVRLAVDARLLSVPVLGKLVRRLHASRMARTLSVLIGSGVPALDAIGAAKSTVTNAVLTEKMTGVLNAVREGTSLSAALRQSQAFPPILAFMAASGETSGRLDVLLEKAADQLDRELENATAVALGLLEPAIVVLMGAMVAVIVMAIVMPIFQLNSLALM
ncbi:MAG: type II secretion system inner membrane protein GspF [Rhodospirillaceae bacterium]|nr:type II secretion system inner membrane protein GspF [Rhodospirillaceae bacterium]